MTILHAPIFSDANPIFLERPTVGTEWRSLGSRPFAFRHNLAGHPLFDLPRLSELAKLAASREAERRRSWRPRDARPQTELIGELEHGNHWLKISQAEELDPDYARLHDRLITAVETANGSSIRSQFVWSGMTIFMNLPGLYVPYHFDHDRNFLLQVRGVKDVDLYDQRTGASCVRPRSSGFCCGDAMAGRYRDELDQRGTRFVLRPGDAIFQPPLAPHRIVNRDEVSVSVSFFFALPEDARRSHVYQLNSLLRPLRLATPPPGRSKRSDSVKHTMMRFVLKRRPRTYDEMLYSGYKRLTIPARVIRKLAALGRRARARFTPD